MASSWADVRRRLRGAASPVVAAQCRFFAPTAGTVLGIKVPALRAMVKEWAAANRQITPADAAALADQAFASGCREEQLFATFLLNRLKSKLGPEEWKKLDRWVDRIDNWEACDQLATGVAGEMIGRAGQADRARWTRELIRWATARNPWRRRFAVAATTALNQKGRRDAATALQVCACVVADEDIFVRKAIGWALREATRSDAAAVYAFLHTHRATLPRSVLRESAQKLQPAQRKALGLLKAAPGSGAQSASATRKPRHAPRARPAARRH